MTWRDVALIAGPVLAWLGARYSSKQSLKAASITASVTQEAQSNATEVERKRLGLDVLEASLDRLDAELNRERTARNEAEDRAMNAEVRAAAAEARAQSAEDGHQHLSKRMDSLTATLAAHGQWDLLVLAEVRRINPEFIDPPPLNLDC